MGECLPVVAVVATLQSRLHLLTGRALPSIANQTKRPDLVVVVSDNEPLDDFIREADIAECFDADSPSVRLIPNSRTQGNSGTGAWNTGILEALACFGEDCWIAILDDDDEWESSHIEACLEAAKTPQCKWVVSGIIRCTGSKSGRKQEPLLSSEPEATQFFATNPGIQGSNLFVQVRALLGAGLFDESLPSTTDRDLCIRLCDLLSASEGWFASTGQYTVVHYADANRLRVSTRGSLAKIQGLKKFYLKHAPRMSESQRLLFKERAANLFDCKEEEFCLQTPSDGADVQKLKAWSGDELPLNMGTLEKLPKFQANNTFQEAERKRHALFGIITSDNRRIRGLLDDLSAASESSECNFDPFVVVFANDSKAKADFSELLKAEIKKRHLRGHVLSRASPVVGSILQQCRNVRISSSEKKLPIATARTVLQAFIYNIPILDETDAVVIIDDDKRLPQGWSPFVDAGGADILIGRDLRTPPNPALFSLRTNLIDLIHHMDLIHLNGPDKEPVKSYCLAQSRFESSDPFDQYYDLSSCSLTHLELPVYADARMDDEGLPQRLLRDFLVGTPFRRDVIPLESGPTLQRGGCMVILKGNFRPLAVQQHAPIVKFSDGTTSFTRRSDSFWCKEMKDRGFSIAVQKSLFVYHDNRFDTPSTPEGTRKNVVQEVIGGILCRGQKWRNQYKEKRLLHLRSWFERVRGILTCLRNRPYCTEQLVNEFIAPLEQILNPEKWEEEVFTVIEASFDASFQEWRPNPTDFSRTNTFLKLDAAETRAIEQEWNTKRIEEASKILQKATGCEDGTYVGLGSEGVSFRVEDVLYKVFDLGYATVPRANVIKLADSEFLKYPGSLPILKRPFLPGIPYRGGQGLAMVKMLRKWKRKNLYHRNFTPNNLIFNKEKQTLSVVDIGRDLKHERSNYLYQELFEGMCKRAYLCFRFGDQANNPRALKQLKEKMREDFSSVHLVGFPAFMRSIYDCPVEDSREQLRRRLEDMGAVRAHVIPSGTDAAEDDDKMINQMHEAIAQAAKSHARFGVVIEDPFCHESGKPLFYFRRHLCRFQWEMSFSLEEESMLMVDPSTFQEFVGFHVFVLNFEQEVLDEHANISSQDQDSAAKGSHQHHLLIKSCPMEHQTILSDVRRAVHCLEASTSFKSIVLVADLSRTDGFIRQYTSANLEEYSDALQRIKEERLVDDVIMFDGKDSKQVLELNKIWLGRNCLATHSAQGQHYTSTFFGFEFIKALKCYSNNDVVLQMDSDIIIHSEKGASGSIAECMKHFDDPKLLTFAFPILSSIPSVSPLKYLNQDGRPLRFEVRISFVHLGRMTSMLPLHIPEQEASIEGSCIKRGWWHVLDHNIEYHSLKSCRGAVGDGKSIFFIHPPNEFKDAARITNLGLVSDILASNQFTPSDLEKKSPWRNQLRKVNLQSIDKGWFRERDESIVIGIDISEASYGSAVQSFQYLARMKKRKMFQGCGVIIFDNGSANREDVSSALFERAKKELERTHFTAIAWRQQLKEPDLQMFVRSMCTDSRALVFMLKGGDLDMRKAMCLLPRYPLKFCNDCGSYYDQNCVCFGDSTLDFDATPCTSLPVSIPPIPGQDATQLLNSHFFASDTITEGKLRIEITALVNGLDSIEGAEGVCVRIHSECLTGDGFYSMKCDCGIEKLQFLHVMAREEGRSRPSALVYIKGHEGRGAGLPKKIEAYCHLARHPRETHVDALHAVGCESDIRRYDAAAGFVKRRLRVKSVRLFTNNPKKIEAVERCFGPENVSTEAMPAVPTAYNETYLKEKIDLLGHEGLL